MRIFIDIAHPAYFHFLRNFIRIMSQKGHDFFISAKDKEVTLELFDHYRIKYYNRGKAANSPTGKALNIIRTDFKLLRQVRGFNPDLVISFSSPVAAHLSFLLRKPCIAIEDTECAGVVQKSYLPFSQVVLTPSCFCKKLGRKQIYFDGYKELAYLHPNYFVPQADIQEKLGLAKDERYAIVRFVSHNALHDLGESWISDEFKIKLVETISRFLRVFITSETKLSVQLEPYQISIPSWEMHSVLSGASLLIGESSTMAAEAAVLGVPAIFIDNQGRGYTNELEEKYKLVFNYKPTRTGFNNALNKAVNILKATNLNNEFQARKQKMLSEKIDVTSFLVWFIENYPKSAETIRTNPEFQYLFK